MGKKNTDKPKHDPFAALKGKKMCIKLAPNFPDGNKTVMSMIEEIMMKDIAHAAGIPASFFEGRDPGVDDFIPFNPKNIPFKSWPMPKDWPHDAPSTKGKIPDDMWWTTADGRKMLASTMDTRHMFFSLRLLFNRMVPPEYRVSEYDGKAVVRTDNDLKALQILFKLLNDPKREDDITEPMWEALIHMQRVVREIL